MISDKKVDSIEMTIMTGCNFEYDMHSKEIIASVANLLPIEKYRYKKGSLMILKVSVLQLVLLSNFFQEL